MTSPLVPVDCGTCREHGVGRAALRSLNEDLGGGQTVRASRHDGFHLRADDTGKLRLQRFGGGSRT